jgi:hypothetical protein
MNFLIRVRALPSDPISILKLRQLLKRLGQSSGLQCVLADEVNGDFLIRVRTLPGEVAPIVKLRRLLKRLGRACALKCVEVREVAEQIEPEPAAPTARERGPPGSE